MIVASEMINEEVMKSVIKENSPLYFFRSTPFSEHSEFNYNGELNENFFFEYMFSEKGRYKEYAEPIVEALSQRTYKTILLTGNQGCGKSTFVHHLKRECPNATFLFFDFDQDTSNPLINEYIERLSNYLLKLFREDRSGITKAYYDLYRTNIDLITQKINAENKIKNFFEKFYKTFILEDDTSISKDDFIKEINSLFFNQILSLIILWHICIICSSRHINKPIIFCFDNLDVLVNQEIIERFFREYLLFVRNIDSIVNNLDCDYIRENRITYNKVFSFIIACRQHTWARVKNHYPHYDPVLKVSTLHRNLTYAFDKRGILAKRGNYINRNRDFFGDYYNKLDEIRAIMIDMDSFDNHRHSIYDLFDNDYRQCTLTFEDLIEENPDIVNDYAYLRNHKYTTQGRRGIIYRALFEKFKNDGNLGAIGVLDINKEYPLVSNARLLLNYLNYTTYNNRNSSVSFSEIVKDFKGIISREEIDLCLIAMFQLGFNSSWNELVAFDEINTEEVKTCEGTRLLITTGGHEYLDLMATHFEYFNARTSWIRNSNCALFSPKSIEKYIGSRKTYESDGEQFVIQYNFEQTIYNVYNSVKKCCNNMVLFYRTHMAKRYPNKSDYLNSPYVYGDSNVLHGERIVHTHIRYIDNFRLYLLNNSDIAIPIEKVNRILTGFIGEYLRLADLYPDVFTEVSIKYLFPYFEQAIEDIKTSGYTSKKPINLPRKEFA